MNVNTGKCWGAGQTLIIKNTTGSAYFVVRVVSYNIATGELSFVILVKSGVGEYSSWNITLTGEMGPSGPVGGQGPVKEDIDTVTTNLFITGTNTVYGSGGDVFDNNTGTYWLAEGNAQGDPNWDSTKLLIQSEATTSNAITDISNSQQVVTRYGDARQSSQNKKFGNSSMYFDGDKDFIQITDAADLRLGAGDFTVEFWLYWEDNDSYSTIASKGYIDTDGWGIQSLQNSTQLQWFAKGNTEQINETDAGPLNQWLHYAFVREGISLKIYRNGVETGSGTSASELDSTDPLNIGATQEGDSNSLGNHEFKGYMEEFRITKGVARSISASPTTAFGRDDINDPYWDNVTLLLPPDVTSSLFTDSSPSNHAIIPYGGVQHNAGAAKWGNTSINFDGSVDRLAIKTTASTDLSATDFAMGGSDFTVESWVRLDSDALGVDRNIIGKWDEGGQGTNFKQFLLSYNGAGYANNFNDSSDKNHSIDSHAGTVAHDSNEARWGDTSIRFDGNGDYLTIPHSTDFNFDDSHVTIEFWWKHKAHSFVGHDALAEDCIISKGRTNTEEYGWMFRLATNGYLNFSLMSNFSGGRNLSSDTALDDGTWHHIAVCKDDWLSQDNWWMYVDGVKQAQTVTDFTHNFDTSYDILIGAGRKYGNGEIGYFGNFWLEDFRFTKGVARYPSQLGATSATNIVDSSDASRSITINGDVHHSEGAAKWGHTSLYFDGAGDYLTIDQDYSNLSFSADLTVECWIKTDVSSHSSGGFNKRIIAFGNNPDKSIQLILDQPGSTGGIKVVFLGDHQYNSGAAYLITNNTSIDDNNWHHVALVRKNGVFKLYVDGNPTDINGSTAGLANTDTWVNNTDLTIGKMPNGSSAQQSYCSSVSGGDCAGYWEGYMDEIRVSEVARYDGSFNAGTLIPFVSDTDTELLIHSDFPAHQGGATSATDIVDSSNTSLSLGLIGDVHHTTSKKKFNFSSIEFDQTDGSTDYIDVPTNSVFNFGTNDFTVEFWMNSTGSSLSYNQGRMHAISFGTYGSSNLECNINDPGLNVNGVTTNKNISWYWNSSGANMIRSAVDVTDGEWHHIALQRTGTTIEFYIDGVKQDDGNDQGVNYTAAIDLTSSRRIIGGASTIAGWWYVGYLDEIRISKTARYCSHSTCNPPLLPPPGTAFNNDDNTVLLIHSDWANFGFNPVQAKTGTDDEHWSSVNLFLRSEVIGSSFNFKVSTDGTANAAEAAGVTRPVAGPWYHVAGVRHGNVIKLFVNGNLERTVTCLGDLYNNWSVPLTIGNKRRNGVDIGADAESVEFYKGYMEDIRVSKVARYTTTGPMPASTFIARQQEDNDVYLKVDYGAGVKQTINKYYFTVNSTVDAGMMPKDWHLQASDNDVDWSTLDTRINQFFVSGRFNYGLANTEEFRYYRMHLVSGHSTGIKLTEMDFVA
jgi:hypothetical protein